jgi:cytidylate kinase
MANLLTREEAADLAKSVATRGKSLNKDIQKLAAAAIGYANVHGDVTVAQGIYESIANNKGLRIKSFVAYLEKHGKLEYSKDAKNFIHRKRDDVITDVMELFLHLAENPWYEAIKEKDPVSMYDLSVKIAALVKQAESMAQQESVTVAHFELLEPLRALVVAE